MPPLRSNRTGAEIALCLKFFGVVRFRLRTGRRRRLRQHGRRVDAPPAAGRLPPVTATAIRRRRGRWRLALSNPKMKVNELHSRLR